MNQSPRTGSLWRNHVGACSEADVEACRSRERRAVAVLPRASGRGLAPPLALYDGIVTQTACSRTDRRPCTRIGSCSTTAPGGTRTSLRRLEIRASRSAPVMARYPACGLPTSGPLTATAAAWSRVDRVGLRTSLRWQGKGWPWIRSERGDGDIIRRRQSVFFVGIHHTAVSMPLSLTHSVTLQMEEVVPRRRRGGKRSGRLF